MKNIVKAIIKDEKGRYLIFLRNKNTLYFPYCWDLAGGSVKDKEKRRDAIKREVKEETNFDIEIEKVEAEFKINLAIKGSDIHRYTIYKVRVISGKLKKSKEHLKYRWEYIDKIYKLPLDPYLRIYLNCILREKNGYVGKIK